MITNVYGASTWVTVSNPVGASINNNTPSAGLVRYHNSQMQVYDGYTWLTLGGGSSVGLTANAEEALAWAWLKMTQEKAAQGLAQKHPAVADALDAVRLAEQQLKTVVALCTV
jgi:hypothetical protein